VAYSSPYFRSRRLLRTLHLSLHIATPVSIPIIYAMDKPNLIPLCLIPIAASLFIHYKGV